MSSKADTRMKRWQEQRWILDAVIRTVGIEWDQGRVGYGSAPGGAQSVAEFRATAAKIKRVGDFVREFSNTAKRREAKAENFEADGRLLSARTSYLGASLLWAAARLAHLRDQRGSGASRSPHERNVCQIYRT